MGLIRLLKHDLARETRYWVDENMISRDQAAAICRYYGLDYQVSDKSKGYHILILLGYLFMGLALLTLVGANWEDIPRELRMGGLVGMTLGVNLMGFYKLRKGASRAGTGFFFLGSMFYGITIMLIAQIYHLGEHFPDGILWWALGVLPLGLLLKSLVLMILATSLGLIWFFVESGMGYFPWVFPVFISAMAVFLLYLRPSRIIFMALVLCSGLFMVYGWEWALTQDWKGVPTSGDALFLGAAWILFNYGFSIYLDSRSTPEYKDYGVLLNLWTLRFFILTLFIFSFKSPWRELFSMGWHAPGQTLALGGIFCALCLVMAYGSKPGRPITPALICLIFLAWTGSAMVSPDLVQVQTFQIIDNIILVTTGIWLIITGIQGGKSYYFFLGVITILLTGLLRYIDLVGNYVGGAGLFALFALILLATARFWKSRLTRKGGEV